MLLTPPSKRRLGRRLRAHQGSSDPTYALTFKGKLGCLSGSLSRSALQVEASFIQTLIIAFVLNYVFFNNSVFLTADLYTTKTVVFRGLNVGLFNIIKRRLGCCSS